MLTEWQRQQLAVWMRDIDKAGEWEWVVRALDEHGAQLTAAEKRATEAEHREIMCIDALEKAAIFAKQRTTGEFIHPDDAQRLLFVIHGAIANLPARAQAVSEVLEAADKLPCTLSEELAAKGMPRSAKLLLALQHTLAKLDAARKGC